MPGQATIAAGLGARQIRELCGLRNISEPDLRDERGVSRQRNSNEPKVRRDPQVARLFWER